MKINNMKLTLEQLSIIKQFNRGNNIRIISGPGCGKTTTLHQIYKNSTKKSADKFLYLTYNARLKTEARIRFKNYSNVEAHNFDSFIKKYFNNNKAPPYMLSDIKHPNHYLSLRNFTKLFIDEAQDMTELHFKLICEILKNYPDLQIVIVGDPKQSIYEYNGGSPKYLLDPEKYFKRRFRSEKLSITFRVPTLISRFINNQFLVNSGTKIYPSREGGKVEYYLIEPYKSTKIRGIVMDKIRKYGPDNVTLLMANSPSELNNKAPQTKIINQLSNNGVNIWISGDSNQEEAMKGKFCVSSYHCFKGMERKCVIIWGFDESYDKYFNHSNISEPNPLYVALTRASNELVLLHTSKKSYYPTVNINNLHKDCNFNEIDAIKVEDKDCHRKKHTSPTTLSKHININFMRKFQIPETSNKYIGVTSLSSPPLYIKFENITENISHIYGILPQLIYQLKKTGKIQYFDRFGELNENINIHVKNSRRFVKIKDSYIDKCITKVDSVDIGGKMAKNNILKLATSLGLVLDHDTLQLSNLELFEFIKVGYQDYVDVKNRDFSYSKDILKKLASLANIESCSRGFIFPLYQITNYDWIDESYVDKLCKNLNTIIANDCEGNMEVSKTAKFTFSCHRCQKKNTVIVNGRCDYKTKKCIYEFKVTNNLRDPSYIYQCLAYSSLFKRTIRLVNLNNGEYIDIEYQKGNLHKLIEKKYGKATEGNNEYHTSTSQTAIEEPVASTAYKTTYTNIASMITAYQPTSSHTNSRSSSVLRENTGVNDFGLEILSGNQLKELGSEYLEGSYNTKPQLIRELLQAGAGKQAWKDFCTKTPKHRGAIFHKISNNRHTFHVKGRQKYKSVKLDELTVEQVLHSTKIEKTIKVDHLAQFPIKH